MLATVAETFAVAPGIREVSILTVRRDDPPLVRRSQLSALGFAIFDRDRVAQVDVTAMDAQSGIGLASYWRVDRKGRTGDVAPIDLTDEPEVSAVMKELAGALDAEVSGTAARMEPTAAVLEAARDAATEQALPQPGDAGSGSSLSSAESPARFCTGCGHLLTPGASFCHVRQHSLRP